MDNFHVTESKELLAQAVCDFMASLAREAVADRGVFRIALAGGSTPKQLYELLSKTNLDWPKWEIFLSDERIVALDDERSNYKLAFDAWLGQVGIPAARLHPIPLDAGNPPDVAAAYEAEIRTAFDTPPPEIPQFDLILLGIGSDGHTASLFPGKPAVNETEKLVVDSPPGTLPPPVDRVTFTLPLINAARNAAFLISGADKAAALKQIREPNSILPAGLVRPSSGNLFWFVTRDAS